MPCLKSNLTPTLRSMRGSEFPTRRLLSGWAGNHQLLGTWAMLAPLVPAIVPNRQ